MMTTRQPLDKTLRRTLEMTVIKARDISELAAIQALNRLSVGDAKPADYLSEDQRKLRTRLRARGRQLGDIKKDNGQQGTHKLVTEVAYEHWHRMLFARFLEQNNLLMYDEYTPLSLDECNELAQDSDAARDDLERRCESGWELAGVLASKMLPQIFRIDSPVFELEFSPEHQRSLEQLVTGLSLETFQAQDSLGWVYQFWQTKRKEEVNKSEVKIGADELSPVTQLFTEPYMVSFLLDNALGAWWAGKRLTESDWQHASSEQELRDKAAIEGVSLEYLRFAQDEKTKRWQPASGTFKAWPDELSEFKAIDPCCGSGHFLVAAFLMLVPMRMHLEGLTEQQAIDKVLSENLHGLELDQRCVELAAFAVALEAWRYPKSGGYRSLPELHLACSGLSINVKEDYWLSLAGDDASLRVALDLLYKQFKDAPVLGSLINPKNSLGKNAFFQLDWEDITPLLEQALKSDSDIEKTEMSIVANGIAKAFHLLTRKYHLVSTNVPYLGMRRQNEILKDYLSKNFELSKGDLATVFIDKFLKDNTVEDGCVAVVTPSALSNKSYFKGFRKRLLENYSFGFTAFLGPRAFETITGEVVDVMLLSINNVLPQKEYSFPLIDVFDAKNSDQKLHALKKYPSVILNQQEQLKNPGHRIQLNSYKKELLLLDYCDCPQGIKTGDDEKWLRKFWELSNLGMWEYCQSSSRISKDFGGLEKVINWSSQGMGMTRPRLDSQAVGKWAVGLSQTGQKRPVLFIGARFDSNIAPVLTKESSNLLPVWAFCNSQEFIDLLEENSRGLFTTNTALLQVPFNLQKWIEIASEQYPNGLSQPYTNDPTQWIFHGHPCGSVVWDEEAKWTAKGELRVDESVLQVAVARLLGYQWPAELDQDMELAEEQRQWVVHSQELNQFTDDDGIVCLPAVRGEKAADQRLESLLQAAYGDAWTTPLKNRLLEKVGGKSLAHWLRDKFFEQHCKMFQHRPFIWHIWDGLNDGFSALVNYHMLDKAGLERLIYTYLGDWIRTQQSGMASGEDGAQERLAAAEALKRELEAILEGEAPYDIFVRWKPLAEQPIGWNPDLNDGVRLNIRPFLSARDVSKKDAGILRWKPNVKWTKDRGKDVESAPWYKLGLEYEGKEGDRINDHHLTLADKL